ncbi:LacI family DNA-binding transcriptional regulator [Chitinophaga rhizosphaerae]|uniref:LacI family DNA-binding transcriptional regulator n=1 Tax=Chitinophaga rhizosphaerae TaxID=1864947 RepID=UPI000F813C95|nr:LacI family DNA-binding transcriptional regulator [Chitinophaga rhizosphaerae]
MTRHQVTFIDIAGELNLSKSTVSRALTGHRSVKPYTRQAVPELAEKLDDQRNMAGNAGYATVICQSDESDETEVANTRVMPANQVAGMLVSITRETRNYDHLKIFRRKGIRIVFADEVVRGGGRLEIHPQSFENRAHRSQIHLKKRQHAHIDL